MLVITGGLDRGSQMDWRRLARYEQVTSTAVFGLLSERDLMDQPRSGFGYGMGSAAAISQRADLQPEAAFDAICQMSGGLEFGLSGRA